MSDLLTMVAALLFPLVVMAFMLWLTHLEETLPGSVAAAQRQPVPEPILAIAVPEPLHPEMYDAPPPRPDPVLALAPEPQTQIAV